MIYLTLKNITNKNFKKYGDIINTNKKFKIINNGFAKNYPDLCNIEFKNNGKTKMNIFKAKQRKFPMTIDLLERHPLGTQAFFPLNKCIFIVVVSLGKKYPLFNKIESFIVPPYIGINYKIGVWHYPLIAITNSKFIVIDRKGNGKNLEKYKFKKEKILLNYGK